MESKNIIIRYLVATLGLFLVALGVALSIKANLGTAPLSCPAYVLNLEYPSVSVGTFIFIVNMVYMIVQILLLRSDFKASHLMQIVASILFGYMVDACLWMLSSLSAISFLYKFLLILLASLVTAVGVSLEVKSNAWMLSAEMTVSALSKVTGKRFDVMKIVMDCSIVVISGVLAMIFFQNPFGMAAFTNPGDIILARQEGIVIGLGTVILAFLPGFLLRFIQPLTDRFLETAHILK